MKIPSARTNLLCSGIDRSRAARPRRGSIGKGRRSPEGATNLASVAAGGSSRAAPRSIKARPLGARRRPLPASGLRCRRDLIRPLIGLFFLAGARARYTPPPPPRCRAEARPARGSRSARRGGRKWKVGWTRRERWMRFVTWCVLRHRKLARTPVRSERLIAASSDF